MSKIIALLALLTVASSLELVNNRIVLKNVERMIDLTSQLVKITTTLTLENTGRDTIRSFLVVLEPGVASNLSYISAKDSGKDDLLVTSTSIEDRLNEHVYNVKFSQSVASGRTATVEVELIFTESLLPHPSTITQKEKQLTRYFGSHYYYSPYVVKQQTTTVSLNSKTIESYTKLKPVSQSESTIVYGPYENIPPYSVNPMAVHFENNAMFLTVLRLERIIEVSHWGNIAVEEKIDILHTGAKLRGSFSRYDYQRDTNPHSIKSYLTILPAAAHSIYYRDTNGNISTSQVRIRNDWVELDLRPRFPLFGGWRSSYILGYSVPSYQYLYKVTANDYMLKMRLLDHVFDDMQIKELETSIILPFGVSNVQSVTPYETEHISDSLTYKYLDTKGRQVVRFRKTNLVEQHIQDFEVTYSWQPLFLLHEPILLLLALYVMFLMVIVYMRVDFSLCKPEHVKTQ